jgi:hypothetical protein
MQIAFVSSLTAEDEAQVARAFLAAFAGILDILPIAYSIRITTSSGTAFDRTHLPEHDAPEPASVSAAQAGASVVPFSSPKPPVT